MSRSNTHYYNICTWEVEDDGYCWLHRPSGRWNPSGRKCILPGKFETRRGIVERKPRFPRHTPKSWSGAPPMSMKKLWRRWVRSQYRSEMERNPLDPVLPLWSRLYGKQLHNWY